MYISYTQEWNKLPIPRPNSDALGWLGPFQVRAHIYQAKNLQARVRTERLL